MKSSGYFISCDWGTTNFRLRLVEKETLQVVAEHRTNQGVKKLHDKYGHQNTLSQEQFFSNYLQKQIRVLPNQYQKELVVVSGMASSNIGLTELPYTDMPFDFQGTSFYRKKMILSNRLEMVLISGVKSRNGMMRGEETQAIGLAEQLHNHESGIMLLPGTHSKHLSYNYQQFTTLKNFMTGELFSIISQNSILSNSVVKGPWCSSAENAFLEGLTVGIRENLTASLLSIRVNDVIQHLDKEDNYFRLSGMLIGDELSYLTDSRSMIFLGAPDSLLKLYQVALENIIDNQQLIIFKNSDMEHALLAGQRKILAHYDQ